MYHLTRLLFDRSPNPSTVLPMTTLEEIFTEFKTLRMPRTSALVKAARALGDIRVVSGLEACLARDEKMKLVASQTTEGVVKDTLPHPFS